MSFACSGGGASSLINGTVKRGRGRRVGLSSLVCRSSSSVGFPEDAHHQKHPNLRISQEKLVQELVLKQSALVKKRRTILESSGNGKDHYYSSWDLDEAYNRCMQFAVTEVGSVGLGKSPHRLLNWALYSLFKLGTSIVLNLEEQEQLKASAAMIVWGRRTDELVDGNDGCGATPEVLDRWEQRLIDLYEGRPHDIYDAALSHTFSKYPIDLQLFKDLIQGMRMDMSKTRYENFDELSLYIYRVAGTLLMMLVQLTSAEHKASVYNAAIAYAVSGQLTDIMRDLIEDRRMGRIYLPQDELARAGLSEDDINNERFISQDWRNYVKELVKRARAYADEGDKSLHKMNLVCRLYLSSISLPTRHLLDLIEANDYNLSRPTPVKPSKLLPDLVLSCCRIIIGVKFRFS